VSRLRKLLQAFDRQAVETQADKLRALSALNRTLRQEIRGLQDTVGHLAALTRTLQARTEQLTALRDLDATAGAQLTRLSPLFDVERVGPHVEAAVARGVFSGDLVPHLVIAELLPVDAFAALRDAIPPRLVFDERAGDTGVLAVPPRLAPVASIVAWDFVRSAIVPVLAPAVAARFQRGRTQLAAARLVWCGTTEAARRPRVARGRILGIVSLFASGESAAIEVDMTPAETTGAKPSRTIHVAVPANGAVAVFDGVAAYHASTAEAADQPCVWEFELSFDATADEGSV
jgi:hypothetical protein